MKKTGLVKLKRAVIAALGLIFFAAPCLANDIAPAPRNAPRTPVARQNLEQHHVVVPTSRAMDGNALVIDSEKLRLGEVELRLFGIVPPQLSASFGPQARAVLDHMVQGLPVHCQIRDRASDGRLLATCVNANNEDLALELLRRGLAVTARGSLLQTELATSYANAELSAQSQKLGLWAPAPAATSVATAPVAPTAPPVLVAPPVAVGAATVAMAVAAPATATVAAQPLAAEALKETPPSAREPQTKPDPTPPTPINITSLPVSIGDHRLDNNLLAASMIAANPDAAVADVPNTPLLQPASPSWLERYQLMATGLIMLITALSIVAILVWQRRRNDREEKQAVAAALRGELMAARAICYGRLQQARSEGQDGKTIAWPRLRSMVFQAYVGRIGELGAELARQVASIYGLASDYAAYYNQNAGEQTKDAGDKIQALSTLVGHIETVLPRLAKLEGKAAVEASVVQSAYASLTNLPPQAKRVRPLSLTKAKPVDDLVAVETKPVTTQTAAGAIATDDQSEAVVVEEVTEETQTAQAESPNIAPKISMATIRKLKEFVQKKFSPAASIGEITHEEADAEATSAADDYAAMLREDAANYVAYEPPDEKAANGGKRG